MNYCLINYSVVVFISGWCDGKRTFANDQLNLFTKESYTHCTQALLWITVGSGS